MNSETIYHRYRLKRRTTAGWAANNEVLGEGEPGIELLVDGTEKVKFGDGVKAWAQLSYALGGGGGAGAAWLQGTGIPAGNLGKLGDFYLRTSNGDVYGPKGETWGDVVANLASTVTIGTVSTAPPGEPAMVSNSGTAMDPVLDFRLPRGDSAALSNGTPQVLGTATPGTSQEASRADHRHQMPTAAQVGADASGTAAAAVAAHAAAADPHPDYVLESDLRLSNPRTPTAHKSTHATGGTDALSPADIGAATTAQGAKADTAIQPGNAALSDAREWNADTISQAEAEAGTATTRRAFTAARIFQAVAAWWAGSAAKTKLDGIANNATANATDAELRNRSTHTGTQPATTITGLSTDAVPEGSVNLYHTTLRAAAAAPVQSVAGRTGNVTLAKSDVGLSSVDNTSDANKPISTATAAALAGKVDTTDIRLSDARTPTAHNQAWSTITGTPTTLGGYGITDSFNPATPGAIGGTTPGAGSFSALLATTRLGLPSGAPASPVARDLYQVADTLRYRDSAGNERLLLNATDNLANLSNTSTARTNLSAVGTVTTGITGAAQITNIVSISQANYDAITTKNSQTLYIISG